jgi:hypothetical protein
MTTVVFYNFIVLSSTFFVYLSEKGRSYVDRWVLLCIAFLLVFVPSAIRYDVGVDFFSYISIYENLEYRSDLEKGFYFINWILKSINAHPQWSIVTFAFIFTAIAFYGFPKKNRWLIFLAFILTMWFFSFNGIRQAIAVAFSVWAVKLFLNNKIIQFTLVMIVAGLFHQSAWLVIPIGYIALVPLPKFFQNYLIPILMIGFIGFVYFKANILFGVFEQVLNTIGMIKYANYFSNITHFVGNHSGTNLGILIILLFCLYFISISKYIIFQGSQYRLLIYFVFGYAVSTVLAVQIVIFSRMQITFIIGIIYAIYVLWDMQIYRKLNKLIALLYIIFLLASFIKLSIGTPTFYADPKRNPYQTIFDVK